MIAEAKSRLNRLIDRANRLVGFDYDAAKTTNKRKAKTKRLYNEDKHLKRGDRKIIVSTARDQTRNHVLLSWMIRKYLDFVVGHNVKFNTGDKSLDRTLKDFVRERSKRKNFDVRRKHSRRAYMRLAEARRLIDNDFGTLKLRSRNVQAIEGDRILNPERFGDDEEWSHGVRSDSFGRPLQYSIHKRTHTGFEHERNVSANRMIWHACNEANFRFDTSRGVSPITGALDEMADFYESKSYAAARVKVEQAMGLVITSEGDEPTGSIVPKGEKDTDGDGYGDDKYYEVDMDQSPWQLELNENDDAKFLSTNAPGSETVDFLNFCILVFCKAFDLPYSFFREDFTNFFGIKIAFTLMLLSARPKREEICAWLDNWLEWQLFAGVAERDSMLPRGLDPTEPMRTVKWIPDGIPWFDWSREVRPRLQAIAGGIELRSNVIAQIHGMDLDDFLELKKAEDEAIADAGIEIYNFDKVESIPDTSAEPVDAIEG